MSMSRMYVNDFVCVFVILCFDLYANGLAVFFFPFLSVTVSGCVSCCVFFLLQDLLLYTEDDQLFWMGIGKSDSDRSDTIALLDTRRTS